MVRIFGPVGRAALRQVAGPEALMVFDYDGTLTPHVAGPAEPILDAGTRRRLARLGRLCPRVAVLSGRALDDLLPRLRGIPLAAAIGNHGAEWQIGRREERISRGLWWLNLSRQEIAALGPAVAQAIEDKRFSYVVKVARLSRGERESVLAKLNSRAGIRVYGDARSLNVVPAGAPNKGDALCWLEEGLHPSGVLFVGNDQTDEDAFAAKLRGPFLSIRVGRTRSSSARAYLGSQAEMPALLDDLVRLVACRSS